MSINLSLPVQPELKPKITVIGVGGAGGNAVNNMIRSQLEGVEFVVANTDAQALTQSRADRRVQLGITITQGLGAGSRPDIGRIAAEEAIEEIIDQIRGSNMAFIAAGMGGGTGTGAAPVIARAAREQGILTVGVVTKPFHFEGAHRMRIAENGIEELEQFVDTLIIIPNQNLFRVANERTTFADAFKMADDVLYAGVRGVTDLMVMPGMVNLDFADIRAVMSEMGKAMMGTGEAEGENKAKQAAEAAISNPLLDDATMKGARAVLINVTGGMDMTLFEVDEAANRIRSEVDPDAYIIFGSTFDEAMEGRMRVSVVATGMDVSATARPAPTVLSLADAITPQATGTPAAATSLRVEQAGEAAQGYSVEQVAEAVEQEAYVERRNAVAQASGTAGHEVFIPPAPASRSGGEAGTAPARLVAASSNGTAERTAEGQRQVKPRVQTFLDRFVGKTAPRAPVKAESPTPSQARERAPASERQDRSAKPAAAHVQEHAPVAQPADDILDIPAFLRRQAN